MYEIDDKRWLHKFDDITEEGNIYDLTKNDEQEKCLD